MTKTDGRKLDRKALDAIREMAIARVAGGENVNAVMDSYGLCRTTYYKWTRKMEERGVSKLLSAKPTGRPSSHKSESSTHAYAHLGSRAQLHVVESLTPESPPHASAG